MKPSAQALDLIKKWEGCRLEAYKDIRGLWTIGYGCTGPGVGQGVVWTQAQADGALEERVATVGRMVSKCIVPAISQNQFDALTSLCYNIGQGAFRGSTLLRLINTRKYKDAANEFPKWAHVNGVQVEGLLRRRLEEAELFLRPASSPPSMA